jgi:hypothetical protein
MKAHSHIAIVVRPTSLKSFANHIFCIESSFVFEICPLGQKKREKIDVFGEKQLLFNTVH